MYWIIDVIIVLIVVLCVIRGLQRGLVMALFDALTLVVALAGAFIISNALSHHIGGFIETPINNWVENRMENIEGPVTDAAVNEALRTLGINENIAGRIENTVTDHLAQVGYTFQNAVVTALVSIIARTVTFIIAFIALVVGLRFTARLLDTLAKLPLLNLVNKLGGLGAGLLQGILIVWLGVTAFTFLGVITAGALENSFWLRIFW